MTNQVVTYRAARLADLPRMVELLDAAGLPSRLIEEHIEGFMVAEAGDTILACGGVENHGDTAVLRSVAVDAAARGSGIGRQLSLMLIETAKARGAADLYLFTGGSHTFWQRLGFTDAPMEEWRAPARHCWQYRYVSQHPEMWERLNLHSMWRPA